MDLVLWTWLCGLGCVDLVYQRHFFLWFQGLQKADKVCRITFKGVVTIWINFGGEIQKFFWTQIDIGDQVLLIGDQLTVGDTVHLEKSD